MKVSTYVPWLGFTFAQKKNNDDDNRKENKQRYIKLITGKVALPEISSGCPHISWSEPLTSPWLNFNFP